MDNQYLAVVVDLGREFGRDSMMSGWVLDNKTFVADHARKNGGLFYRPFSDIGPVLVTLRVLFLCM